MHVNRDMPILHNHSNKRRVPPCKEVKWQFLHKGSHADAHMNVCIALLSMHCGPEVHTYTWKMARCIACMGVNDMHDL